MSDAGALIVGGDYRGLGIVRSLGRRGIPVWVVKHDDVLAGFSRFARVERSRGAAARRPNRPSTCSSSPTSTTCRAGCCSRPATCPPTSLRGTTTRSACVTSSRRRPSRSSRSRRTSAWRTSAGSASGSTCRARGTRRPLDEAAEIEFVYPVILKPASGVIDNPLSHVKAWKIDDRETLLEKYAEASPFLPAGQVMIQEIIPGGGECQFSFAAACLDGAVHASLTARRTRQIPMDFGRASTYVETMDVPEIVEPATRIIASMGLTGLVEVEFKRDPRSDQFKLLDVNSRAWGWHSIAAAAGVDFPYLVFQLARGEAVEPAQGRPGVRWVRLTTDLSVSAKEVLGGRMPAPHLPEVDAPADRGTDRGQGRSAPGAHGAAAARPPLREPGAPPPALYEGICPRHLSQGFLSTGPAPGARCSPRRSASRYSPEYQMPMQPKRSPLAFVADERQPVVAAAHLRERVVDRERGHGLAHRVAAALGALARMEVPLDLQDAERRRARIARVVRCAVAVGAGLRVALGVLVPRALVDGQGAHHVVGEAPLARAPTG